MGESNARRTEDFVYFFSGELPELVDASDLSGAKREAVEEAILAILTQGLMPAFERLKRIRLLEEQPLGTAERKALFEDFSRVLWYGYRQLFPDAAMLLGFDIGFIFQKDTVFKKGVAEFKTKHPMLIAPRLGELLQRQRGAWQNGFARFRNQFGEGRVEEPAKFAAFYEPQNAEMLFAVVWGVMANVLPVFIEANFAHGMSIEEIPEGQRDAVERRRFRFVKYGVGR